MEEEIREYEEMRKEEKERMEAEINELMERREIRKKEREEEERIAAEKRAEEEAIRKAQEEEKRAKKQAELERKRQEREERQRQADERSKASGRRSFKITRKDGSGAETSEDQGKEEVTKSKEQLEAEKQAILAQRVQPLNTDGLDEAGLREKAQELHATLLRLVSDKYDLEERYKERQREMMELAERARAMNKGKKMKAATQEGSDPISEKYTTAPPKIQLCSKYERHTDRRNYEERKTVFGGPIYAPETPRILPGGGGGQGGEGAAEEGGEDE